MDVVCIRVRWVLDKYMEMDRAVFMYSDLISAIFVHVFWKFTDVEKTEHYQQKS